MSTQVWASWRQDSHFSNFIAKQWMFNIVQELFLNKYAGDVNGEIIQPSRILGDEASLGRFEYKSHFLFPTRFLASYLESLCGKAECLPQNLASNRNFLLGEKATPILTCCLLFKEFQFFSFLNSNVFTKTITFLAKYHHKSCTCLWVWNISNDLGVLLKSQLPNIL